MIEIKQPSSIGRMLTHIAHLFTPAVMMSTPLWSLLALALSLLTALWVRPWRQLRNPHIWTPVLASLVFLPWFWALPRLHAMPLQLQLTGSVLVTLMLGWPMAVWVLLCIDWISSWIAPTAEGVWLEQWFELAWLPSSLALLLGAALRRYAPPHPFIFILGRGFLGAALCIFAARGLTVLLDDPPSTVDPGLSLVAQWLMAWGDAFLTGLLTAVFVAFKPEWLATWSDQLYLHKSTRD